MERRRTVRWMGGWAGALVIVLVAQLVGPPAEAAPVASSASLSGAAVMPEQLVKSAGIRAAISPEVQVTTSLTQVNAAQAFTVAATSSIAATTVDPIFIIDFTVGTVLKTCTSGTTCSISTSFISAEPRQYIARHGTTETAPVTVTPNP